MNMSTDRSCQLENMLYIIFALLIVTDVSAQSKDNTISSRTNLKDLAQKVKGKFDKTKNLPQFVAWSEKCKQSVGEVQWEEIEKSPSRLVRCFSRFIEIEKVKREINQSMERGELDLVFKKYCGRRDRIMGCMEDILDKVDDCLNDQQKKDMNITRNALNAAADFICYDDGDRIALFMAEGGVGCVKDHKQEITDCIKQSIPRVSDLEKGTRNVSSFSIDEFTISEANCKKVTAIQNCFVSATEKCKDPTPANIIDALITQMLKVTPCWQTSSATTSYLPMSLYMTHLIPHILTLLTAALMAANILL